MIWQDIGYLLYKNKYNENSSIVDFFTKKRGKVTGIIYGSTSRKIKSYLMIGNKFFINFNTKNENKMGYFNVELDVLNTPLYFEDQKKLSCINYSLTLIRTLTVENQENLNLFNLVADLFRLLKHDTWINNFILWELEVFNKLGYNLNFNDYVVKKNTNGKTYYHLKDNENKIIPKFLIDSKLDNIILEETILAINLVGDFLDKSILKPNNLNQIIARTNFVNNIK